MTALSPSYRLSAATAIDRGDRLYQQDQVEVLAHPKTPGCLLAILADGMGGKSGGRKAADQVLLVARQLFERFTPGKDKPTELLRKMVLESHVMIKLTAITSEQEPHSTIAAGLVLPNRECHMIHAGDSRVYLFRGADMLMRTFDHSLVQRMVEQGELTEEEANDHPHSNLLTGCLGADEDPPMSLARVDRLELGDTLLVCSDGLWHYFTPRAAPTRRQQDADQQGTPARPRRRRQPVAGAGQARRPGGISCRAAATASTAAKPGLSSGSRQRGIHGAALQRQELL